jgi:hypothetical protein
MNKSTTRLWLFRLMYIVKADEFTLVVVNIWAIWHARWKASHEEVFQSPLSTHLFIGSFVSDLSLLPKGGNGKPLKPCSRAARWLKPLDGCAKVNVDTSVLKS